MALPLPDQLTLPSGAVVQLRRGAPQVGPGAGDGPLLLEALSALAAGRVLLTRDRAPVDARTLVLRDFHVLCAVLARSGVIVEAEVEISCRNCGAPILVRPCARLEIGPWADGELGDPDLDDTLPFGEPVEVPPLPLGRVRVARSVTLEERTVAQAMPLLEKAAEQDFDVDVALVQALGIVALGDERDPERIAGGLARCDEAAFAAVAGAFLDTHYVPRLACVVFCGACRARNDVDAPYERELVRDDRRARAEGTPFPDLARSADRARAIAAPLMAVPPSDQVELVIDDGTPPVDDAGETLLGSYLPVGDAARPTPTPLVSVYYRTFRAVWEEEGPYDWEEELAETIEHELEHHGHFLRGYDPMDDEEREEIRDEAVRIVGRREAGRRELVGFGRSLPDFLARTWPLWVIALIAALLAFFTQD
ncbi:hypothetical protein BH11MYX4_BH11MYX4_64700 [soil metagenome]